MSWWKEVTLVTAIGSSVLAGIVGYQFRKKAIVNEQRTIAKIETERQEEKVHVNFWSRAEMMHSILFPLISSALQFSPNNIVELYWGEKYESVPLKNYHGDKMSGLRARVHIGTGLCDLSTYYKI